MIEKKDDTVDIVIDLFNNAMDLQAKYLKKSKFKQLSMSEMHVISAVNKESKPSMSAVANRLNITLGTLTTAVKKIIEKGFLVKEQSNEDQRIYYLRLTDMGKEALAIHVTFYQELARIYTSNIPDDRIEWVFDTLKTINKDLLNYKEQL